MFEQITTDVLYKMVKEIEIINQTLSQGADFLAIKFADSFKTAYHKYGYTLLYDELNRLVLLEKIQQ